MDDNQYNSNNSNINIINEPDSHEVKLRKIIKFNKFLIKFIS